MALSIHAPRLLFSVPGPLLHRPQQFQFIVADESHYLKSVDAKRSQAVVPLMQKAGESRRKRF